MGWGSFPSPIVRRRGLQAAPGGPSVRPPHFRTRLYQCRYIRGPTQGTGPALTYGSGGTQCCQSMGREPFALSPPCCRSCSVRLDAVRGFPLTPCPHSPPTSMLGEILSSGSEGGGHDWSTPLGASPKCATPQGLARRGVNGPEERASSPGTLTRPAGRVAHLNRPLAPRESGGAGDRRLRKAHLRRASPQGPF